MGAGEPEEGFKVTDRRGRSDEFEVAPRAPEPSPAGVRATPAAPPPPPSDPDRSLVGLFMMLAGSAAMALGEVEDPVTGQRQVDLEQAADVIDLLMLLREKTEGHRSAEETQALDGVLYDLQLRYVSVRNRGG